MLSGLGPFRLADKQQGRVTAAKSTATCLLVWKANGIDAVLCGTAEGSVILQHHNRSSTSTQQAMVVLKPKRAVTRLVKVFHSSCVLAVCGGEIFCLEGPQLLRHTVVAFQGGVFQATNSSSTVIDLCVNQRGPPDWGLCAVTQDFTLHLFSNFSSSSSSSSFASRQYEPLRRIKLHMDLGAHVQACWYENVICVGGELGVLLVSDDDDGKSKAEQQQKRIPMEIPTSPCCYLCIVPLPEGQILISTGPLAVVVDLAGNPVQHMQAVVPFASPPMHIVCSGPYLVLAYPHSRIDVVRWNAPGRVVQRLIVANAAPCLASANPYLFGELLYVVEEEGGDGGGGEIPCAFAVGLAQQHSDTLFRMAEPLKLVDRVKEVFAADEDEEDEDEEEDDEDGGIPSPTRSTLRRRLRKSRSMGAGGHDDSTTDKLAVLTQQALSLVAESFPPSCLAQIKSLERVVHVSAGQAALQRVPQPHDDQQRLTTTKFAFDQFALADLSPTQLLLRGGDDTPAAAAWRDVVNYTLQWRSVHEPSPEVDLLLVEYLCGKLQDSHAAEELQQALEEFCLDATNCCDLPRALEVLGRSSQRTAMAATHLKSARLDGGEEEDEDEILRAYQDLHAPKFFCGVLLRARRGAAAAKYLGWILSHCDSEDVRKVFTELGAGMAAAAGSEHAVELILASGVDRPRYLIAALAAAAAASATTQLEGAFAQQLVHALEEAVAATTNDDVYRRDLSRILEQEVGRSAALASACVELLEASPHRAAFAEERIHCLRCLGRHTDALRVIVQSTSGGGGGGGHTAAEVYCTSLADSNQQSRALVCLLRILLEHDLAAAVDLLNCHAGVGGHNRLNALEAVQSLPPTVPLSNVHAFLRHALQHSLTTERSTRVEKHLAKSAHFKTRVHLLQKQRQYVHLTQQDRCAKCHNKFTAAHGLERMADGALRHVKCPSSSSQ